MPIKGIIKWGVSQDSRNPLGDPRLRNLDILVGDFRRGRLPFGWGGNRIFENRWADLPIRVYGYYREYYMGTSAETGSLRVVLGQGSEVYVTGNHYSDFIQVLHLPFP
jgi:guanyl-specific ribonuclease Sa